MPKSSKSSVKPSASRRGFLKGAAAGAAAGAAGFVAPQSAKAQAPQTRAAAPPSAAQVAAERDPAARAPREQIIERPGSDYMVDVLKSLGFEYFISNPGSSFRGIHESLIGYAGNKPEFILCTHEEIAASMCNGYAKIEGKPALTAAHGTVGLQHASMAIYNAYCDQAPMVVLAGNRRNGSERRSYVEWVHSVQDAASIVREYTKWDDNPGSLEHWGESMVRAYHVSNTPPRLPVVIVADEDLQEDPIPAGFNGHIPKLGAHTPPAGDIGSVNELARMLVAAENPVLVAGMSARTAKGLDLLVELAELLQCPVIDQKRRMNFPTRHPLNQTWRNRAVLADADLIVGLEVWDFYGVVNAQNGWYKIEPRRLAKPTAKLVSIAATDVFYKSNYQTFFRNAEVDLAISGDAEATMPSLIEAVKKLFTEDKKRAYAARGKKLAEASKKLLEEQRTLATYAWDASPISTARFSMEAWNAIRNEDWTLASDSFWVSHWPQKLWDITKHHQYIGGAGGEGVGYMAGGSLGAALANKKYGRVTVSMQCDGDLMYSPGVLWTAARHRIPILYLIHNNRAYHQEIMQLQHTAGQRSRGYEQCSIGTVITDPNIDYAKMAASMGVESFGPVEDPAQLGPAIKRGIEVVKSGRPYLIDVVTQGR